MELPPEQLPSIPNAQQFYSKKRDKKHNLREIQQIQEFNSNKLQSPRSTSKSGEQFEEGNQQGKEELFHQGKGLISDQLSIKTLGFIQIFWGLLAESMIVTLSFISSFSIWLYLPNLFIGTAQIFYLFSHCLSIITFLKHKHAEPRFIEKTHKILQLVFYMAFYVNFLKACKSAYSLLFEVYFSEILHLLISLIAAYIEYGLFKHAKGLNWHASELKKGQRQAQSDFSVIQ